MQTQKPTRPLAGPGKFPNSNHTNKKLAVIASQLVGLAEDPRSAAALTTLVHDLQRHTAHATAVRRENAQ